VVANPRVGVPSAMLDPEASKAADAIIAARSTDAQLERAIQDETDAALDEVGRVVGDDQALKAAVDAEMKAADLTEDADTYARAAEAMASCQLRRGAA